MISLESLPDAVVAVDGTGRIVPVNAHAATLFGFTREEMMGQPIELLIPSRFHAGHKDQRFRSSPRSGPVFPSPSRSSRAPRRIPGVCTASRC